MDILFFLSRVPWPLDKGDKLRAYHQMRELSAHHRVHLIALADEKPNVQTEKALLEFCTTIHIFPLNRLTKLINIFKALIKGKPAQVGYFTKKSLFSPIQKIGLQLQPDVVFFQLVRTAEYADLFSCRKIIDFQDALSEGLIRRAKRSKGVKKWLLEMEASRMKNYESMVFERFPNRILITETDRDIFPHPDRNQISIVPNGVDLEYFKPNQSLKTHDIIFAGNMNYPPNVDAVLFLLNDIMPIVWKRKPQTKVLIAGANPAASIRQKASDLVEITGWVDDISEAYSSARIFVAPMRIGTGLQNKLLEAMASGLPCITSPLAFRPLKATKNIDVLVAETADDYANLIVELIDNHIFWEICSLQGRKFVEKNYSWKTVGNQLNDLFTSSV